MRLARYEAGGERWVGAVEGEEVVPLAPDAPGVIVDLAMRRGEPLRPAGPPRPLAGVRVLAPVGEPPSVRDFYAFEEHARTARRLRGLELDPDWYELPVFYFSNPATVYGPEDVIPYPRCTQELDYELEFAWVLGRDGSDLSPQTALDAVAGYTVFNDLSARDLQRREMRLSLGPAKGKDFASAFGPFLVTPDELPGALEGRPQGRMVARVNGEEWSRGDMASLHHDVGTMVAYASRDSRVRKGDVMGSGTCGGGCILELRGTEGERYRWLRPGDVVELEIEGLGVLRNTVGPPRPGGTGRAGGALQQGTSRSRPVSTS